MFEPDCGSLQVADRRQGNARVQLTPDGTYLFGNKCYQCYSGHRQCPEYLFCLQSREAPCAKILPLKQTHPGLGEKGLKGFLPWQYLLQILFFRKHEASVEQSADSAPNRDLEGHKLFLTGAPNPVSAWGIAPVLRA